MGKPGGGGGFLFGFGGGGFGPANTTKLPKRNSIKEKKMFLIIFILI